MTASTLNGILTAHLSRQSLLSTLRDATAVIQKNFVCEESRSYNWIYWLHAFSIFAFGPYPSQRRAHLAWHSSKYEGKLASRFKVHKMKRNLRIIAGYWPVSMRRHRGYQSHQRQGRPWSNNGTVFHKQCPVRSTNNKQEILAVVPPERERAPSQGLYFAITHIVSGEVVDVCLGKHRVIFQFALSEGRSVAGNDDQLCLSGSQHLEGRFVAESDFGESQFCAAGKLKIGYNSPLPDFITSARRELMLSVVFFAFFGAIVALYQVIW